MIHTLEHPIAQMIQMASMVLDGVFELFRSCGWATWRPAPAGSRT